MNVNTDTAATPVKNVKKVSVAKKPALDASNSVTLSLNRAGIAMFKEDITSVRVRVVDGVIQVRPSIRTKGMSNFPDDEIGMLPIHRTKTGLKIAIPAVSLKEVMPKSETVYEISELKYGWLALVSTTIDAVSRTSATAKVQLPR